MTGSPGNPILDFNPPNPASYFPPPLGPKGIYLDTGTDFIKTGGDFHTQQESSFSFVVYLHYEDTLPGYANGTNVFCVLDATNEFQYGGLVTAD